METGSKDYPVCDQCRVKKIRCGREKPFCANCIRVGQDCEWSGQGKKSNQATVLSHSIIGLGSRIEKLESSVLDTQQSLKRLLGESSNDTTRSRRPKFGHELTTPESSAPQPSDAQGQRLPQRPVGRLVKINNNNVQKRYFGPVSLECLMLDVKKFAGDSLGSKSSRLRECVLQAQRQIDLLVHHGGGEPLKDRLSPTLPPIVVLEAMIEPYFEIVHPHLPIWSRKQLENMVSTMRGSTPSEDNPAIPMCCNSLIIMTLAARALRCRREKPSQVINIHKGPLADCDVIARFLASAKRSIQGIGSVLSPRLINLQALLSLCIVAQVHFSSELTESLFALATQCAKAIGIYEWQGLQDQLNDEDIETRQPLSYCLYIMDKRLHWISGSAPDIPITSIQFDVKTFSLNDNATARLSAKVELFTIIESIHSGLYACHITNRSEGRILHIVSSITRKLDDWLARWRIDLNLDGEDVPEMAIPTIELAFDFLCVKLLQLWPYKDQTDMLFQQRTSLAKKCMSLLLHLWCSATSPEALFVIQNLLVSHPPLYLYELCTHILSGQGDGSDSALLQRFIDMLEHITNPGETKTYCERLRALSTILMDMITTMGAQLKQHKTVPCLSPPSTLQPLQSPLHSPELVGTGSHDRGGSMNPHPGMRDYAKEDFTGPVHLDQSDPGVSLAQIGNMEDEISSCSTGRSLSSIAGNYNNQIIGHAEHVPFNSQQLLANSVTEEDTWWDQLNSLTSKEWYV